MTTPDESRIATQPTRVPSEDNTVRPEAQAWQLGILTDHGGCCGQHRRRRAAQP